MREIFSSEIEGSKLWYKLIHLTIKTGLREE